MIKIERNYSPENQKNLENEFSETDIICPEYFSNIHIDLHYDASLIDKDVKNRILSNIDKLQFLPHINEKVNEIISQIDNSDSLVFLSEHGKLVTKLI